MKVNENASEQLRLDQMPVEELKTLAGQLMVRVPSSAGRTDLAGAIGPRLELIEGIDREALLSIAVWGRRPVARSADKLALVREISQLEFRLFDYDGLQCDGLMALVQLRDLDLPAGANDQELRSILVHADGLGGWWTRKRRAVAGAILGKLFEAEGADNEYQFLPESPDQRSLRRQIEQQGVVGGIASKLKGAANDYVNTKLDEIERRIDSKLDQIDRRLAEWRDREISNRLRIIKITLIGSIIVALISLVYSYIRNGLS